MTLITPDFRVVKDTQPDNVIGMVTDILDMARCRRADPAALTMALADVLAITAGRLERHGAHVPMRERMESFTERVLETYARAL